MGIFYLEMVFCHAAQSGRWDLGGLRGDVGFFCLGTVFR